MKLGAQDVTAYLGAQPISGLYLGSTPIAGGGVPSTHYRFFIPGQQQAGSGNAEDLSGKDADAVIPASYSDAELWANTGYMTTKAGTGDCVSVPNDKIAFNLATQSVIFAAIINKAVPAGGESIFSAGDAVTTQGFYLSARSGAGKLRPVLNTSGGVVTTLADSTAVFCDASDRHVVCAIDGITKAVYLYADGVLSNSYLSAFTGGTTVNTSFNIGANPGTPATATSYALKTFGLHFLVFDGALPLNINVLAQRLSDYPTKALTDSQMAF